MGKLISERTNLMITPEPLFDKENVPLEDLINLLIDKESDIHLCEIKIKCGGCIYTSKLEEFIKGRYKFINAIYYTNDNKKIIIWVTNTKPIQPNRDTFEHVRGDIQTNHFLK